MKSKQEIYQEMQKHIGDQDMMAALTIGLQCSEGDLRERIIMDGATLSRYKKRIQIWKWIQGGTDVAKG